MLMALRPDGDKMIFALLTKVPAFHVRIAIVKVGVPCLQRPLRGFFSGICWRGRWSRSWSRILAVFQIRLHILPKQVLGGRRGRSSSGRSRCSGARCSGGGAWSRRAKVCLEGGETTRIGGSSGATEGGSPGYSWGRSSGNTLGDSSLLRGSAAGGSHLVRWKGAEFLAFQKGWLNRWWSF